MKILNRAKFLKCPPGTIYARYQDGFLDQLRRLVSVTPEGFFHYSDLVGPVPLDGAGSRPVWRERAKWLDRAAETGESVPLDFQASKFEGATDGPLFAVYEPDDVAHLLQAITGADMFVDNGS